jgi:hypothetical protein
LQDVTYLVRRYTPARDRSELFGVNKKKRKVK